MGSAIGQEDTSQMRLLFCFCLHPCLVASPLIRPMAYRLLYWKRTFIFVPLWQFMLIAFSLSLSLFLSLCSLIALPNSVLVLHHSRRCSPCLCHQS